MSSAEDLTRLEDVNGPANEIKASNGHGAVDMDSAGPTDSILAPSNGDPPGAPRDEGLMVEEMTPTEVSRRNRSTPFGRPGQPFDRTNPMMVGFLATIGVAMAYVLVRTVNNIKGTLVLIGLALFIAVGLEPLVAFATRRGAPRSLAVTLIVVLSLLAVAGFVALAIAPISHEAHQISIDVPKWRDQILHGRGTLGRLAVRLHINSLFTSATQQGLGNKIATGALGAGKLVLNSLEKTVIVIVLTVYFLASLPSVKRFFVRLSPASRRPRVSLLLDEILSRVGGFVLGNLFTSLVAGIGTLVWLEIFGIPDAFLLSAMVALFDLIPVVGSSVAGIIVSLVALGQSVPIAVATAGYYFAYRFLEDYLLTPRVMRHAVKLSPIVTVLGTLVGGAVLGIIGALVAIPIAAAVQLLLAETAFPRLDKS